MSSPGLTMRTAAAARGWALALLLALIGPATVRGATQAPQQLTFASPDEAATALVDAAKRDDVNALIAIFGPDGKAVVSSGDEVQDAAQRKSFAEAAAQLTRLDRLGDDRITLVVGKDEWPLPVPIVKQGDRWRFDTAAGKTELLNRRIGRNELHTIEFCRAYVDAQNEYAAADRDGNGVLDYAAKFFSSPGKHDGLYWPAAENEPESPMGPLAAAAVKEGYRRKGSGEPMPFHGYYFRVLTAQGPHAPGGAKHYVKGGRLTEGFALVAYPAVYGVSGVMTFIVNQQGIVFQDNLGAKTAQIAARMTRYDPDASWVPVAD